MIGRPIAERENLPRAVHACPGSAARRTISRRQPGGEKCNRQGDQDDNQHEQDELAGNGTITHSALDAWGRIGGGGVAPLAGTWFAAHGGAVRHPEGTSAVVVLLDVEDNRLGLLLRIVILK